MKKEYFYVRVSGRDQCAARQLEAARKTGIPPGRILIDRQSGKDFERPAWKRLLTLLRAGDTLNVLSIDRLGRGYEEILAQWRQLTKEMGVDIRVMDMPLLDTTLCKDLLGTFIADLVLQLLSFVAQNEREQIHFRQAAGIQQAKKRGVCFGRPKRQLPPDFPVLYEAFRQGTLPLAAMLEKVDMPRSTFYQKLREYERENFYNEATAD